MPFDFLPYQEFLPDLGRFRNPGLTQAAEGQLDVHGSWSPAPAMVALPGSTIAGNPIPTSVFAWPFGPTDYRIYAGADDFNLYEYDPAGGGSVNDVSRTVGGAYTGTEWFFTGFGGHVMAVNGVDADQILLSTAATFENCYTSTNKPIGRYITSFGNKIWIGNYSLGGVAVPHGVWWSALEDARQMGTPVPTSLPALNTDNQPLLDDLGHVMGFSRGRDYVLIARERGWNRVDGPPYQFSALETSDGVYYSRSIADLGPDTYYLSQGSVKVIRGGAAVVDIGRGKVARYLFDSNFIEFPKNGAAVSDDLRGRLGPSAAADPGSSLVAWHWLVGQVAAVHDCFLVYNTNTGNFSFFRGQYSAVVPMEARRLGSLAQRAASSAAGAWGPLRAIVTVIGNNPDTAFFEFSSTLGSAATFPHGFSSHTEEAKHRYVKVRPVFRMKEGVSAPTITITCETVDYPHGPIISTAAAQPEGNDGWFYFGTDHHPGNFLAPKVQFGSYDVGVGTPLGVADYEGLQVVWQTEGTK